MYAIYWKDRDGSLNLCSIRGQAEVYDSLFRAEKALELWQASDVDAKDEYVMLAVNVKKDNQS